MAKSRQPRLLDLVAVTHCPGGEALEIGDVGTVFEMLPPDGLEVEFLERGRPGPGGREWHRVIRAPT